MCLTRIGVEGTFLAVNEAALSMLGGERLDQVLDKSLVNVIAPDQRERCRDFLERLESGDRRSAEFDITGFDQLRRVVQIHAVSLANPFDGIPSALCTLRDVSEHRRLERTVVEAAARADAGSAAHAAERERLSALEQEHQDAMSRARADHEARTAELERQLADAAARETALAATAAEQQTQAAELRRAVTSLEAAVKDAADRSRRLAETHETERAQWSPRTAELERRLADATAREAALAAAAADEQRQTTELRSAITSLEKALAEAADRGRRLAETHETERAKWNLKTAELEGRLAEAAAREIALAAAAAEQQQQASELRRALTVHDAALKEATEHARRLAEAREAERAEWTPRKAELERQLADAAARETALAAAVAEHQREVVELRRGATGHEAALKKATDYARRLTEALERERAEWTPRRAELEGRLAEAAARETALAAAATEHQREVVELRRAVTSHEAALKKATDRGRQLEETREAERAEWNRALSEIRAERQTDASAWELRVAELERTMTAARDDLARQAALHHEEVVRLDALLAESVAEQQAIARRTAQALVERQALEGQLRRSDRLARAGRVAVSVATDLESLLGTLSERGRALLLSTSPRDDRRDALERVVCAAIDGASLARQISLETRRASGRSVVNVSGVVQQATAALVAVLKPDIRLDVLATSRDAEVAMTADELEQLLLALTANRRAALPTGGVVTLDISEIELDEAGTWEHGVVDPGAYVRLVWRSSGAGAGGAAPEALFGKGAGESQWRGAGTGLGTVFRLTEAAGGHMCVRQESNDATALEIFLPRIAECEESIGGASTGVESQK